MSNMDKTNVPLFSIITVCLNAGESLKATADSVLRQSFEEYEYIIKDGESNDGSIELINDVLNQENVKLVIKEDGGIYDAMNQGLSYCQGKYVLFLNAGDQFAENNTLEQLAHVCKCNGCPGLVYTDYVTSHCCDRVSSPDRLDETFLYRTMLCHQACYVRRDLYERLGGFDTSFLVEADFDFLMRLTLNSRASYLHVPIVSVIYLSGGYSSTREGYEQGLREVRRIRRMYFPPYKRFFYGMIYSLTLPKMRNAVLRNPRFGFLTRRYSKVRNRVYEILYKR